ncbi:MAG: hydantoinase B/oxoprolinase family protein [Chloroflexi bacterium]|nr:hydantoinase B/oxoprolinase family protein [Chloroflexota bacterium]
MAGTAAFDPITFEVVRHALTEATEEMAVALRRSAYSTNIKTRADFSCAFFDRDLNVVAQAFCQAVHLGSLVHLVPIAIRAYGPENLNPGDAILCNDPYLGGVHLNDISLISPVYCDGELFGYVANMAHHVDVGGGAPASVGAFREVYQEGIIIPPVKLVAADEIVDDVFRLILGQIRSKRETAGDFRAQIAANTTGTRRLRELIAQTGLDTVNEYIQELMTYAERRTRAEIAKLPQGEFMADGYVDNDGYTDEPVRLVAKIVIDENGVLFDLNGCDPQRRAPVNSTFAQTFSACAYNLKCLMDPDIPPNQGFYRMVRIEAPEGTVVNCRPPAPVVGGWETHARLNDVIFKALAPVLPERSPAGGKAMQCHAGFGGIDPRNGEYYCFLETLAGGYGGRFQSDGPDAVQTHGQNTENAPIEETERYYPVRILRYELVDDSEGPGKFRGGLGLRRDYVFPDHDVTFTVLADRDKAGPWGLFGGEAGRPAFYLHKREGATEHLSSKTTIDVRPGEVIRYETCGGGGHGPPWQRDPVRVLNDVRQGKVSRERASAAYGVVIDPEQLTVDTIATDALRAAMQGENPQDEHSARGSDA